MVCVATVPGDRVSRYLDPVTVSADADETQRSPARTITIRKNRGMVEKDPLSGGIDVFIEFS